ncbi:MAG: Ig-like domain-containing protein [Ferruginibacter sp.]
MKYLLSAAAWLLLLYISISLHSGCAQIGAPTGGARDSLAPVLVKASPQLKTLQFKGNKITLHFNEYIEVQEIQNNLLVAPFPKTNPQVTHNLKTVTIRLKDSLLPNTTYSIQFGSAIKDVNEGNILKDFSYVFSTGNIIDSLTLAGKVLLAENGKVDSTISVMLYRNIVDTAVEKMKPDFLTRLKGDGSFEFKNLPSGNFNIYALKDGDGNKYYSIKTELFAFADTVLNIQPLSPELTLYAFSQEKQAENKTIKILKPVLEKQLKYSSNLSGEQDLLDKLVINFNNPLKLVDTASLALLDTNYKVIPKGQVNIDSTRKQLSYQPIWKPGATYRIVFKETAFEDSAGNFLKATDTLSFNAKKEASYARITLRFNNYDQQKNPVLQFVLSDVVKFAFPLNGAEWSNSRFPPGEYEIRILYDNNKDGKWTPGNYLQLLQPEKAFTLPQKLTLKANWDNERDIEL